MPDSLVEAGVVRDSIIDAATDRREYSLASITALSPTTLTCAHTHAYALATPHVSMTCVCPRQQEQGQEGTRAKEKDRLRSFKCMPSPHMRANAGHQQTDPVHATEMPNRLVARNRHATGHRCSRRGRKGLEPLIFESRNHHSLGSRHASPICPPRCCSMTTCGTGCNRRSNDGRRSYRGLPTSRGRPTE